MKIVPRKQNRKKWLTASIVTFVVLAALATVYVLFFYRRDAPQNQETPEPQPTVNYNPASSDQTSDGNTTKEKIAESSKESSIDTTSTVTVVITSAQSSGQNFMVRTTVDTVNSTGSCTLTMKDTSGHSYQATAQVQALASSSTCQGFTVPLSSLSSGTWNVTIKYTDGSTSGQATKEVTL